MNWNYKISLFALLLFVYGCATGTSIVNNGEVYAGMSKIKLRNVHFKTFPVDDPFLPDSFSKYDSIKRTEIISGSSQKVFYVLENVYKPVKCGVILCDYGDGKLKSWHYSLNDAITSLTKQTKQVKKQPKLIASSTDNSNKDYILELNNLIKDFENGSISEEEFNRKKAEILK
jgi:hypothetical protein